MKELIEIQSKLNAPKSRENKFGGYKYRSCEDILDAVKPLLKEQNSYLTITDEVVLIGDRFYVKATATIVTPSGTLANTAFAREEETKKGMDAAQITGAASSYARKYALNGLFCIDDVADPDTQDNRKEEPKKAEPNKITEDQLNQILDLAINYDQATLDKVYQYAKVSKFEDLTEAGAAGLIVMLKKKNNAKK